MGDRINIRTLDGRSFGATAPSLKQAADARGHTLPLFERTLR